MKRYITLLSILFSFFIFTTNGIIAQGQKMVVLKLDDVVAGYNGEVISSRWQRVADYLEKKQIKAGLGIIGYSLLEDNPDYFKWITDHAKRGYLEFWNHGFYNRTEKDTIGEFEKDDYEGQLRALHLTDSLTKEKLGLTLSVWGPHWSATNIHTDRALSQMAGIYMTFGYPKQTVYYKGFVFPENIEMEYPVHNPNFNEFKKYYEKTGKGLDYFYLQGHPDSWDDIRWDNFVKIIEFLESEKIRFVTPSEFMEIQKISNK